MPETSLQNENEVSLSGTSLNSTDRNLVRHLLAAETVRKTEDPRHPAPDLTAHSLLQDVLLADESDPETMYLAAERHSELRRCLASTHLSCRERYIIEHRLLSPTPESQRQIAQRFGVSRSRISEIERKLLRRLKRTLLAERKLERERRRPRPFE